MRKVSIKTILGLISVSTKTQTFAVDVDRVLQIHQRYTKETQINMYPEDYSLPPIMESNKIYNAKNKGYFYALLRDKSTKTGLKNNSNTIMFFNKNGDLLDCYTTFQITGSNVNNEISLIEKLEQKSNKNKEIVSELVKDFFNPVDI